MLDKPCRQPVLSLQQHQSIVHLLPLLDSQPFHKLAKISAKCYNLPLHAANIQKVAISCNPVGKIFCTFYLFAILCFRLELRSPPDVNREGSILFEFFKRDYVVVLLLKLSSRLLKNSIYLLFKVMLPALTPSAEAVNVTFPPFSLA